MTKQTMRKAPAHTGVRRPRGKQTNRAVQGLVPSMLMAFGCGMGAAVLLLGIFAFGLERFSMPMQMVRPMALVAAWIGAAVSGFVLAGRVGRQKLLCGLGCGVFYCVCLLLASFLMAGELYFEQGNAALPIAVLLGGLIGGVISAMRASGTGVH